ncbi:hypothetical protein E2C01_002406 [Portunus trituberculatus]|uniref:Uncharacterized protein n=1 Tax=Portunus trituberculatus TaxID=210409 RepID=A0A5B7CKW4_PORTR|nr:hypothetical protein [Portunus trituberculatus]
MTEPRNNCSYISERERRREQGAGDGGGAGKHGRELWVLRSGRQKVVLRCETGKDLLTWFHKCSRSSSFFSEFDEYPSSSLFSPPLPEPVPRAVVCLPTTLGSFLERFDPF